MALRMPKVALLFLVRGELPHRDLWWRWFEELGSLAFRGCMADWETDHFLECAHERRQDPISQQHLFSVRPWLGRRLPALPTQSQGETKLSSCWRMYCLCAQRRSALCLSYGLLRRYTFTLTQCLQAMAETTCCMGMR